MIKQIGILIFGFVCLTIHAQENSYPKAFSRIEDMLLGKANLNFQEAVFITENTYCDHQLDKDKFDNTIRFYANICKEIMASGNIVYPEKDIEKATAQCAVFVFMTDTIPILVGKDLIQRIPFSYNFDDFAG